MLSTLKQHTITMHTDKLFFILTTGFVSLLTACSQDSDNAKYGSQPPVFSDMTMHVAKTDIEEIHVGDRAVVTAHQKSTGKLLNTTTYSWSISPEDDQATHQYKASVIYDQEKESPTDTIVFNSPGTYRVTLNARYNASGNTSAWSGKHGYNYEEQLASGDGRATYVTGGLFYFQTTVRKTFIVKP